MSESKQNDDILFDRNDEIYGNNEVYGNPTELSNLHQLRKVINEMQNDGFSSEFFDARKRVANKLLDIMSIQNGINNFKPELIVENVDIIDEDMFYVGTFQDKMLV